MGGTNRGKDVVCCVVDTGDDVTVAFRVGDREYDHTIQTVLFLEPLDIGPNVIEMNLFVCPGDQVVRPGFVIGCDEVRVVDGGKWAAQEC